MNYLDLFLLVLQSRESIVWLKMHLITLPEYILNRKCQSSACFLHSYLPMQVGKVSFHCAKLSGTLSHRMAVEPCRT